MPDPPNLDDRPGDPLPIPDLSPVHAVFPPDALRAMTVPEILIRMARTMHRPQARPLAGLLRIAWQLQHPGERTNIDAFANPVPVSITPVPEPSLTVLDPLSEVERWTLDAMWAGDDLSQLPPRPQVPGEVHPGEFGAFIKEVARTATITDDGPGADR